MSVPFELTSVQLLLLVPAIAAPLLALITNYRLGAGLNVFACALTFGAGVALLFAPRMRSDVLIVDDFNIFFLVLTTFVGFTTSVFSATYIAHELETGRLTPLFLRFYHAMYQAMMLAMNVALLANNTGLMWVGVEVATLSTVMMVGIYRTHEAIEAAWKYFILGSVGIALAFFGTILIYLVAQEVLGEGLPAMAWDLLVQNAAKFDPRMMSLGFVFLLVGYGTKVGLAPFHAWLPDAHAEGPTPISAVLSGLLLNVALYALLRFKMVLAANPATLNVGAIMVVLGLISLFFAAFMLYRRRDIKRLFAYSSIEHMGVAAFAFGMGGPLANFAGLLHMTMHSLTKSAIFFAVGHIAQVKGTQRIAEIGGLSVTHPVLAVGFSFGVLAIAGLPPFGIFASEFILISSTFARQPVLAVLLVVGLLVAFGALILRLQDIVFGDPKGPMDPVEASYVPLFVHLALVVTAGLWLPPAVVGWFHTVAALLG
jgi:hydrogenase-4 component F